MWKKCAQDENWDLIKSQSHFLPPYFHYNQTGPCPNDDNISEESLFFLYSFIFSYQFCLRFMCLFNE